MNKKNKAFITASFIAFGLLALGVGAVKTEPKTVAALTTSTPQYLTYGSTNNGSETTSGCPSNFKIYMYGETTNGTGTMYQNELTNWSYYYIYVDAIHVSDHRSFSLYKNGLHFMSQTMSGSSDEILYDGVLSDGEYELEYTCRYAKNIFYDYTYYTYTYRFEVDKTAPKYTLMAGGEKIKDGSYTNKQIVYTATDANFACIRYKKPNATSYAYLSSSSSYTIPTTADNGWWYIYATDAMNQSNTAVSVYLDTIAPVGKVVTVNGASVNNGGYTNREIKYWATDEGSGISYYEYKKPGATGWEKYKTGTAISGTGWHTFRACDSAGNYSEEYKVYYDAVQPFYSLYHESTYFGSGSYTNAEYVIYSAGDSASGLSNCWVKLPDVSYYSNYVSGTRVETEGLYYFYATDRSGNITPSISITIDKTKPTGTLYTGDAEVKSGTITNAENVRFIPYDAIGLSQTYVKKPDSNAYESYESGMEFTQEGTYEFYSVDKAMNVSETYTVTLDRQIPKAQLYVDEKPFNNNGYTNGAHIKFECTERCFVQLPNSDIFTPYISGVEYYKPGKYVFYGESPAGNSTGYYTVIIDRTEKMVETLNVVNGVTSGNVIIDWTDGDKDVYAPIKSVSVNGKAYTKGQTIYTIDTGMYEVNVVDEAGNTWFTVFGSERINVFTQTLQKEYYEAYDTEGTYYAFASYDSALAFAKAREKTYVRTGEWNGTTWDTGIAMDAKDSVNAVNGRFYIYKKSAQFNEEVAYFTEERLNEVVEEYAKIGVNSYYYWEKEPTRIANGENLFTYSDGKAVLANFVEFDGTLARFIDGEEYVDTTYAVNGYHILKLVDEWGNECEYELRIVRTAPVLKYILGGNEGTENTVTFDRKYYFKDQVSLLIEDRYDEMAMFRVYDENGDLVGNFSLEENCLITQSGSYTVIGVNHAGESETFMLVVSRDAPQVSMTENVQKKQLTVVVTPSIDDESRIQTLEIYKSTDDGKTWVLLEKDDYGKTISTETLAYAFRTTATYKIFVTDEFRTGIDAVKTEYSYRQRIPEGTLLGVGNGGYTNTAVTFEWTDEAVVNLAKDGERMAYESGQVLTANGTYNLTLANFDGYMETYTFTIDTEAPKITTEGAKHRESVNEDVRVYYTEENLTAELFKDGKSLGEYVSGNPISADGYYRVRVCDRAGNEVSVEFTIDKSVDYQINIYDKGLSNSVMATSYEILTTELTKDGNRVDYALGTAIVEPGNYMLVLIDSLGNKDVVTFRIIQPLVTEFTHNYDDVEGFGGVLVNGENKRLNYGTLELLEDGKYQVEVIVGGESYPFTVTVDGTAPTLKLNGVENGQSTTNAVTLTDLSEKADLKVYFLDELIDYKLGEELKGIGNYKVVVADECGNQTIYEFEIKKDINWWLVGIIIILTTVVFVWQIISILRKKRDD